MKVEKTVKILKHDEKYSLADAKANTGGGEEDLTFSPVDSGGRGSENKTQITRSVKCLAFFKGTTFKKTSELLSSIGALDKRLKIFPAGMIFGEGNKSLLLLLLRWNFFSDRNKDSSMSKMQQPVEQLLSFAPTSYCTVSTVSA